MDLPTSSEGPTHLTPGPPHPSISDLQPILVCSKYNNSQYRRHDEDTNTDLDVVEKTWRGQLAKSTDKNTVTFRHWSKTEACKMG